MYYSAEYFFCFSRWIRRVELNCSTFSIILERYLNTGSVIMVNAPKSMAHFKDTVDMPKSSFKKTMAPSIPMTIAIHTTNRKVFIGDEIL